MGFVNKFIPIAAVLFLNCSSKFPTNGHSPPSYKCSNKVSLQTGYCKITENRNENYHITCENLNALPSCKQIPVKCDLVTELTLFGGNNDIQCLPNHGFASFPNLVSLNISGNQIVNCQNESFAGLHKLERLLMCNMATKLKFPLPKVALYSLKFESNTFNPLKSITHIDFSWSSIDRNTLFAALCSIPEHVDTVILDNIRTSLYDVIELTEKDTVCIHKIKLKRLSINHSLLKGITLKAIENLSVLEHFSLRHNVVTANNFLLLGRFRNLEYVDFSCQQSKVQFCGSLKYPTVSLELNKSQIPNIKQNFDLNFYTLPNLHTIIGHHNNIGTNFGTPICWENNHLVNLDLSYSRWIDLIDLPPCFKHLKFLNLRGVINWLSFDINSLQGLQSLEVLLFGSSKLKHQSRILLESNQSKSFFSKYNKLFFLDLSDLGLRHIHTGGIQSLSNLEYLLLNKNKLSSELQLPKSMKKLHHIDLSDNILLKIPVKMIKEFENILSPKKKYIRISNNPFLCTCENIDDIRMLLHTKIHIYDLHSVNSSLRCSLVIGKTVTFPTAVKTLESKCSRRDEISLIFLEWVYPLLLLFILTGSICIKVRWKIYYFCSLLQERDRNVQPDTMLFDVFVAYSSFDEEWVRTKLVKSLECGTHPYSLCIHDRNFLPGENIADNILNAIKHSRKTILIVTKKFLRSRWCDFEVNAILSEHLGGLKRKILAIVFSNAVKAARENQVLLKMLNTVTYLEWNEQQLDDEELFFLRLKSALGKPMKKLRKVPEFPISHRLIIY